MKRHTLVSAVLNITTVTLAIVAWLGAINGSASVLDTASLLGVIAFSLMWVHYAADVIAPKEGESKDHRDVQYIASRIAVLIAILAHPLLVNMYLFTNGYGVPPESYEKLVGAVWPVLLGWAALAAFISFELRGKLTKIKRPIFHANIIAMFLILIHGFTIGMVMMTGWYVWVWWFYLATFTAFAFINYKRYYMNNKTRLYIAVGLVLALALAAAAVGLQSRTDSNDDATNQEATSQQESTSDVSLPATTVTKDQLATNNGKNGTKCWLAIDGVVYDASNNDKWQNGEHTTSGGRAKCGEDLTDVISQSPHGKSVLGELETVGSLQ